MNTVTIRELTIGTGRPKVCVPIIGKNKEEILAAAKKAALSGADLAEWRADWFEEAENWDRVKELLSGIREILGKIPLLFTFRTKQEGGENRFSETEFLKTEYCTLNLEVIKSKMVDLIDVELFIGGEIVNSVIEEAHKAGIKVIASNHDFEKTPEKDEIICRLKKMGACGADILKIAVMPQEKNDVLTLLEATLEANEQCGGKPVVTMSMGKMGLPSRLWGEYFGSAITFGAAGAVSAPGQIEAGALKQILEMLHEANEKETLTKREPKHRKELKND